MSSRHYDGTTKVWGYFSTPSKWSVYGDDGKDGDGVEYVFIVNAGSIPDLCQYNGVTEIDEGRYEENTEPSITTDWLPHATKDCTSATVATAHWYDNPQTIDKTNNTQWVAMRKYDGTNKV